MLAKRVLKYLVGTQDYGLAYDITEACDYDKPTIEAWCDSDYANDKGDRKSITGYVVKLNGQAVSMASVKQDTVATGTTPRRSQRAIARATRCGSRFCSRSVAS
jgi:hypothetical protein